MQPDPTLISKLLADARIEAQFEDVAVLGKALRVAPADIAATLRALKDSARSYNFLVDLFGIDTGDHVDAVYHVRSFILDEELHIKVAHEYGSTMASVWEVFPAALMPERECAEMFGLRLAGHPNPKHLLLTEDVEPLLLKSVEIRTAEEVRNR